MFELCENWRWPGCTAVQRSRLEFSLTMELLHWHCTASSAVILLLILLLHVSSLLLNSSRFFFLVLYSSHFSSRFSFLVFWLQTAPALTSDTKTFTTHSYPEATMKIMKYNAINWTKWKPWNTCLEKRRKIQIQSIWIFKFFLLFCFFWLDFSSNFFEFSWIFPQFSQLLLDGHVRSSHGLIGWALLPSQPRSFLPKRHRTKKRKYCRYCRYTLSYSHILFFHTIFFNILLHSSTTYLDFFLIFINLLNIFLICSCPEVATCRSSGPQASS